MQREPDHDTLRLRAQYKRFLPSKALPWERNPLIAREVLKELLEDYPIDTLSKFPFERLREYVSQSWIPFEEDFLLDQIDLEHPEWILPASSGLDSSDRMEPFWDAYEQRLSVAESLEDRAIDAATRRLQALILRKSGAYGRRAFLERGKDRPQGAPSQFRRDRPEFEWFLK
jgi:hypothetical protein